MLLKQLVAEGVAPWLAPADGDELDLAVRQRTLEDSFQGALAAPGTPLSVVRAACDALLPGYCADGSSGQVSVPVDARLARDAEALVDAGRMLHAAVRRPNALVRLPMTAASRTAMAELLSLGIGVHASLVLTGERYGQVLDAYVQGMERALAAGVRLGDVPVVVSFPVGLFDAEADARLTRLGAPPDHPARATAGPAMARRMFRLREQRLAGGWWRVLRADGALPPRLLWTTGGAAGVHRLVGWNTAHALTPAEVEEAARLGGLHGDTLLGEHTRADAALTTLEDLGVTPHEVATVLETRQLTRLQHDWHLRTGPAPAPDPDHGPGSEPPSGPGGERT
ncbi:transaldolase family protein [Streptomyces sp. NPDC018960]|uniref:transaldolase family protein n=1 Tax=unclassified Streptomyces TaxID=2593676 RepID=UPI00378B8018